MARPIVNRADLTAGTAATLVSTPADSSYGLVSLSLVNKNAAPAIVSVYVTSTPLSLNVTEAIVLNVTIPANSTTEFNKIYTSAGDSVVVISDTANVVARASGLTYTTTNTTASIGTLALTLSTPGTVVSVPTVNAYGVYTLTISNPNPGPAVIDVDIVPSIANGAADRIQNQVTISPADWLSIDIGILSPDESIVVTSDITGVVANASGVIQLT